MSGRYFPAVPCQPGPACSDARGADTLSGCGSPWPGLGRRTLSPSVVADRLPDAAEVLVEMASKPPVMSDALFTGRVDLGWSHSTIRRKVKAAPGRSVPMMTGRGQLMEPMAAPQAADCVTATARGLL